VASMRSSISQAEKSSGSKKSEILTELANTVESKAGNSMNSTKMMNLAETLKGLASM